MKKLSLLHIPNSHSDDLIKSTPLQNIIKQHHINWDKQTNAHQVSMNTSTHPHRMRG